MAYLAPLGVVPSTVACHATELMGPATVALLRNAEIGGAVGAWSLQAATRKPRTSVRLLKR